MELALPMPAALMRRRPVRRAMALEIKLAMPVAPDLVLAFSMPVWLVTICKMDCVSPIPALRMRLRPALPEMEWDPNCAMLRELVTGPAL